MLESAYTHKIEENDQVDGELISSITSELNPTDQLVLQDFLEQKHGNQLLILGIISNTGTKKASSIQLEAELLDKDGKFVYECSEYISKDLLPGDVENYQIKCGCGKHPIPEYKNITVRVVNASSY